MGMLDTHLNLYLLFPSFYFFVKFSRLRKREKFQFANFLSEGTVSSGSGHAIYFTRMQYEMATATGRSNKAVAAIHPSSSFFSRCP